MPYDFLGHTADIRMQVTAQTVEELFSEALRGMVYLMEPTVSKDSRPVSREISLESGDRTSLLIDFLNEALLWMHVEHAAYAHVQFSNLTEHTLQATIEGRTSTSFEEDIKAVTYHEADVGRETDGTWCTGIVFDI